MTRLSRAYPSGPRARTSRCAPDRVGLAVLRGRQVEGELRPEHGGQPELLRGLGEAHHPVEAVVVGDGQPGQPQPDRLLGQLLRVARAVEEAEVGVAVQLGVLHSGRLADELRRLVAGPLAGPGRGVAAVAMVDGDRVADDPVLDRPSVGLRPS